MGITALGWNSLIPAASMTANSSATNMSPGNLQSDQCSPSTGWQTADGAVTLATNALLKATWATTQQTVRTVVLVNTNLTPTASVNVTLWNTGGAVVGTTLAGPTAGYGQIVALFAQDYLCDFVQVYFNDGANPDNHINVGGMYAGPLWIPTTGMAWDTSFDRTPRLLETVSRGGQEWPVYQSSQRSRSFALRNLRAAEIVQQQDLLRVAGLGGNVLVIPNIGATAATLGREAVYGRLRSSGGAAYPLHNSDRLAWGATVTERL